MVNECWMKHFSQRYSFSWCSTILSSWYTSWLHLSEGHKGRWDDVEGLVGTRSEFPESLNLKIGPGISYFIVCSGNVKSHNQETIPGLWRVRLGEAIVLTCLFTAGYGRHRKLGVGFCMAGYGQHGSQWVTVHQKYSAAHQIFFSLPCVRKYDVKHSLKCLISDLKW